MDNNLSIIIPVVIVLLVFLLAGLILFIVLFKPFKKIKDGLDSLFSFYEDNQKRRQEEFGRLGEEKVAKMLKEIVTNYSGYVFNDFTFQDERGYSCNIDHILICTGGVFVIETKSNKGTIYGSQDCEFWYQIKEKWQDDKKFKNPIIQNQKHINHLKKMFKCNPPKMISIIIFPVAKSLDNVKSNCVYDLDLAYNYIVKSINLNKYSKQFVERIYHQLNQIHNEYGISLSKHKENLKKKYND